MSDSEVGKQTESTIILFAKVEVRINCMLLNYNIISLGPKEPQGNDASNPGKCTLVTVGGPKKSGSQRGRVGFCVFPPGVVHSLAATGCRGSAESFGLAAVFDGVVQEQIT